MAPWRPGIEYQATNPGDKARHDKVIFRVLSMAQQGKHNRAEACKVLNLRSQGGKEANKSIVLSLHWTAICSVGSSISLFSFFGGGSPLRSIEFCFLLLNFYYTFLLGTGGWTSVWEVSGVVGKETWGLAGTSTPPLLEMSLSRLLSPDVLDSTSFLSEDLSRMATGKGLPSGAWQQAFEKSLPSPWGEYECTCHSPQHFFLAACFQQGWLSCLLACFFKS